MHNLVVANNNELLVRSAQLLREEGTSQDSATGGANTTGVLSLGKVHAEVLNPYDRWLNVPGRNNSIGLALVESLWVLAGLDDAEVLGRFMKRATMYSDDGYRWRGAYGARLYAHGQLQTVIDRLKTDRNTRQCLLSIYDPSRDSNKGLMDEIGTTFTKDMICNVMLQFEVREGCLDMTVINRSNDWLHGVCSINFIEFSLIQQLVAESLGIPMGSYHLVSLNFHLYRNELSMKQFNAVLELNDDVLDFNNKDAMLSHTLGNKLGLGANMGNQERIRAAFDRVFFWLLDRCLHEDLRFQSSSEIKKSVKELLSECHMTEGLVSDMIYGVLYRYGAGLQGEGRINAAADLIETNSLRDALVSSSF